MMYDRIYLPITQYYTLRLTMICTPDTHQITHIISQTMCDSSQTMSHTTLVQLQQYSTEKHYLVEIFT